MASSPSTVAAASDTAHRPWLPTALTAFSLSHLCFVRAWFSVLYDKDFGYFNLIRVNAHTLVGLALNMLLLALVFWLAATGVQRLGWRWLKRIEILVVLVLFLIPINFVRLEYFSISAATMLAFATHPVILTAVAIGGLLIWRWYSWAARVIRALLLVLSPLGMMTFGRILLILMGVIELRQHQEPIILAPLLAEAKSQPRVVWLILDELDYRLTFSERPSHVHLPAFDRLRAESLFATNALPPANSTITSLPTLITGQRVAAAALCSPHDLRLTLAPGGETARWSALSNVFSRARSLGFNSAAVAWYHPYDRVFSNALSFCSWYPMPLFQQARGRNLGEAMANHLWSNLSPIQQRRLTLRIYHDSLAKAIQVTTNRHYGLSFLHLPGPHHPAIYDSKEDRFTILNFSTAQGYFDNLALTDMALGELRRQMESAGVWDDTWLIVSADHPWRESARYDGRFDQRIPFLVKAPGRSQAIEFANRFNTIVTADFILAILSEKINSPASARDWLIQNLIDIPPEQGVSKWDH